MASGTDQFLFLLLIYACLAKKQIYKKKVIKFALTLPGLELTIYHILCKNVNSYIESRQFTLFPAIEIFH
jgi:hypothetical protein